MDIAITFPPALVIGLIVSTVLPLLVGLVTKTVTNGSIKAVLLAALALVTALLTELAMAVNAGTSYDLGIGLLLAIPTFLVAVGLHFGFWKPVGAAHAAQALFTKDTTTLSQDENGTWRA